MRTGLTISAATVALMLCVSSAAHASSLSDAEQAAKQGRADDALQLIAGHLKSAPNDAHAYALKCIVAGTLDHFDEAINACETAARLQPNSSQEQLQLARAYGAKAGHAGAFYGMRTVGKIRTAF